MLPIEQGFVSYPLLGGGFQPPSRSQIGSGKPKDRGRKYRKANTPTRWAPLPVISKVIPSGKIT